MSKSHAAIPAFILSVTLAACSESRHPVVTGFPDTAEVADPTVLQVKVDLARGRRWQLGWGTVDVFDIPTDELIHVVKLDGATLSASRDTRLPDMLMTPSGAMLVTSNAQPVVWRISPERFEVERFALELDSDHDKDFGFSGLEWKAGGRELHAVNAVNGSVWRIDLARGRASKL